MRIRVGIISAHCEVCGGEEFYPIAESRELACSACGTHASYSVLLEQIAAETVKRAKAYLDQLKAARARKPG